MKLESVTDRKFIGRIEEWLRSEREILVQIEFSRAAGNKSFEFFTSSADLTERLRNLPPGTRVTAFKQPQLCLRGCVDDELIRECLRSIRDGTEFLVIGTSPRTRGVAVWFDHVAGTSDQELKEALDNFRGESVAAGEYPGRSPDGEDSITAYVPDPTGKIRSGVY